jgi:hypothetical protein
MTDVTQILSQVESGDAGGAYFFEIDSIGNWRQTARINASDATRNDFFGHSVALSGNLAIVGSPLKG